MKARNAYCSFCRKSYVDVGPLVEGPDNVYICNDCVVLCKSIIDQEKRRGGATPVEPAATDWQGILHKLDRLIPGQEYAKAIVAKAACYRYEGKGRVLFISPSESSAKFLAKSVAFALGVPFVAGAWSTLAVTGRSNLFFHLLTAADFDIESAQRGVVFVGGMQSLEAQDALLEIWREGVSQLGGGLAIEIRSLLFVCSATFDGLDQALGPLGPNPEQPISMESLRAVGARTDWVSALTGVARVPPLSEENLMRMVNAVDFRQMSDISV